MKTIENKLGPFKHFAARDVASLLSASATNVREEKTEHGVFVLFDLPEGAPLWKRVGEVTS